MWKLLEEKRPRWGVRTSNPGGAVSRPLVGSTPTLFRHAHARAEAGATAGRDGRGERAEGRASAADLKFLHHLPHTREGTSNRKAALESYGC
jgi:hypothetical protein